MASIQISPSLLAADFSKLGEEVKHLEKAGADRLHLDVMDGHFVPNITFGPGLIKALRPHTKLLFEVHLMIAPCDPYLEAFAKSGADIILIHPESGPDIKESLRTIRDMGVKSGVVLNPETDVSCLIDFLEDIDQVLVMSVKPGFGGQSFMHDQLDKVRAVKKLVENRPIDIEIDGGVTPETAPLCIEAGATILVAGTSVFKTEDYRENIDRLRR